MTRPFVDRPITDAAAAYRLAEHAAQVWDLATPVLLRAGMNATYRCDDVVLRVSAPTAPAATSFALAAVLADAGLRVPVALSDAVMGADDMTVTAWEHLASSGDPTDWADVGAMVRRVHALDPALLPALYPLPRPEEFPWWDFETLLVEVGDAIDSVAQRGIEAAIGRWPNWSSTVGEVVCHGDVHPGNVIMTADGAVLIDWDLLCSAPPGWDHAPMMRWNERWGGEPLSYAAFARGYGRSMIGDPVAEAFAELRLVAATLMRLKAGLRSEVAMPEAQRRLSFWRGDADAPMWQVQ